MALAANMHSLKPQASSQGAPSWHHASSPSWVEEGSPMAAAAWRHCLTPPAPQGRRISISPAWGIWVHSKGADPSEKGATGLGKRVLPLGQPKVMYHLLAKSSNLTSLRHV